ncbi:unnamed protein product [Rotaria sp. Silwood2]|nr:unnamed protein product [Rotaria sp. Silwood2]
MEIDVHNRRDRRRRHGEPRLLEKQIRPEVFERCLQFIDIVINQIIYQENIYPSNLFTPRQMYHSLVYQCIDKDISSYITLYGLYPNDDKRVAYKYGSDPIQVIDCHLPKGPYAPIVVLLIHGGF